MRVPFQAVFSVLPDGRLSPLVPIRIGGVQMGPGVSFSKGVLVSGVDLASLAGRDLSVDVEGGIYVLKGAY